MTEHHGVGQSGVKPSNATAMSGRPNWGGNTPAVNSAASRRYALPARRLDPLARLRLCAPARKLTRQNGGNPAMLSPADYARRFPPAADNAATLPAD